MAKGRGARQCDSREGVKKISAGQQIARQAEALQRADDGGGNFSRLEKFQRRPLHILGRDGLDRGVQPLQTSRRAITRIGAREEGTLRHHMICADGRYRDTVYYSVIAPEWPGVKAALETKLKR